MHNISIEIGCACLKNQPVCVVYNSSREEVIVTGGNPLREGGGSSFLNFLLMY